MKTRLIISLLILSIILINCSKNHTRNEFILQGELIDSKTKKVILIYRDINEKLVLDTLTVNNNKFFTKGLIDGATKVVLKSDIKTTSSRGTNRLDFFLEPKQVEILIADDIFKEAIIKGSATQIENEKLDKLVEPIYLEIEPLMSKRNELEEEKKSVKDHKTIIDSINSIDNQWRMKLDEIRQEKLEFAWNNSNSYLSAFIVDHYFRAIPLDSTNMYFNNFNSDIKNSFYGKSILAKIQKRKPTEIGDLAPKFEGIGFNGNSISLEQFKGNYVLLEFWASWCKSCRESNPRLRKLYKTYNDKGLEIISISIDNDKDSWKKAIAKDSVNDWYHINIGRKGSIGVQYNIRYIPDYILIDKDGFIIGRTSSNLKDLEKKLIEIFN